MPIWVPPIDTMSVPIESHVLVFAPLLPLFRSPINRSWLSQITNQQPLLSLSQSLTTTTEFSVHRTNRKVIYFRSLHNDSVCRCRVTVPSAPSCQDQSIPVVSNWLFGIIPVIDWRVRASLHVKAKCETYYRALGRDESVCVKWIMHQTSCGLLWLDIGTLREGPTPVLHFCDAVGGLDIPWCALPVLPQLPSVCYLTAVPCLWHGDLPAAPWGYIFMFAASCSVGLRETASG